MTPTLRLFGPPALLAVAACAAAAYGSNAPAPTAQRSASVTWGSDLTGEPVPIRGTWREDSEFWNKGVHAPARGTITKFRLKTGDTPKTIPIRFSVVRPIGGGKVKVITTTHPPYTLKAHDAGVHTFRTSTLAFKCCPVRKGDIVAVDNRGANTVKDPYWWFAKKPDKTAYSHMVRGVSQDFGQIWTRKAHPGYEVLLQVVERKG
jgi:hypothetical protein